MNYKFAVERPDYSQLASGHVFYSLPGHPAFPVRLASEIFQRCLDWRRRAGAASPCALFDPCCGAGYSLTVLGVLHRAALSAVIGADVDTRALELARRNLSLLTLEGLGRRVGELEELLARFGKESHREALQSAVALRAEREAPRALSPLQAWAFQADATDGEALLRHLPDRRVEVVIADIPYGQHSHWAGAISAAPLQAMLEALVAVLAPTAIVAVVTGKAARELPGLRPLHPAYRQLEQFQVGKRRIVILQAPAKH